MTEVKDKSAVRMFLEQLAVPLTLSTLGVLCLFLAWVFWGVVQARSDHSTIQAHSVLIQENSSGLSMHNAEMDVVKSQMSTLTDVVERGFDRQEILLNNLIFSANNNASIQ